MRNMLYLVLHLPLQLPQTHNLRDVISLPMQLQMLPNTFRAQQLYTFQAHMPNHLRRMGLTVVGRDRVRLPYCAGRWQERSGVRLRVTKLRIAVKASVLLVQKVHAVIITIIIFSNSMGNSQGSTLQRFHSRYNFLQALEDRNFGLIKIYRKKQINFDYVMVFERRFPSSQINTARQQIEQIRRRHTLQSDVALLRIMNVQEIKGNMCDGSALRIYMEYINITLRDNIVHRKQLRQPFTCDQVMYVVQSAVKAYKFLKNLKSNHLTLRPDTIFVNPEDGMLRFNPIRIDPFPTQIQPCGNCLPQNEEVYFQKSQRQFIYELKSLVLDLVEICSQQDHNFRRNYQILASINKAKTLQQVQSCLWEPDVESLRQGKKLDTTQVSGSSVQSRAKFGLGAINMAKVIHPDPYAKLR